MCRPAVCGERSLGDAEMAAKETKQHTEEKAVLELMEKYLARHAAKPSVRLKVSNNKGSVATVETDHPDEARAHVLLSNALGSADQEFLDGIVSQLASAGLHGKEVDGRGLNFMLSVINGIEPR